MQWRVVRPYSLCHRALHCETALVPQLFSVPGRVTGTAKKPSLRACLKRSFSDRVASTADEREAANFSQLGSKWWDVENNSAVRPLHEMNVTRVQYIRDRLCSAVQEASGTRPCEGWSPRRPLHGLRVIDIGCGGGILAESLARLGAQVHGVDINQDAVDVARAHAATDPRVKPNVEFSCALVEDLVGQDKHRGAYDVVCALEVIEHVADPEFFLECCAQLVRGPGSSLFVSTINKTPKSYGLAIVLAEHVSGQLPVGTHDWQKFISPDQVEDWLLRSGISLQSSDGGNVCGMGYDILSGNWNLNEADVDVNYIVHGVKTVEV